MRNRQISTQKADMGFPCLLKGVYSVRSGFQSTLIKHINRLHQIFIHLIDGFRIRIRDHFPLHIIRQLSIGISVDSGILLDYILISVALITIEDIAVSCVSSPDHTGFQQWICDLALMCDDTAAVKADRVIIHTVNQKNRNICMIDAINRIQSGIVSEYRLMIQPHKRVYANCCCMPHHVLSPL